MDTLNLCPLDVVLDQSSSGGSAECLYHITHQIRRSLNLSETLNTTVKMMRSIVPCDRVMIYQFQPDGHGIVMAESLQGDRLPSLLGLHFPADDIPTYARELYLQQRCHTIVNLQDHQIGMMALKHPAENPAEHLKKSDGAASDGEEQEIIYRQIGRAHV